jgi:hypothetical protein
LDSKRIELQGKRKLVFRKIRYLTGYTDSEINTVHYNLAPYIITDDKLSSENKQEITALESFKLANEYLLRKKRGTFLHGSHLLQSI